MNERWFDGISCRFPISAFDCCNARRLTRAESIYRLGLVEMVERLEHVDVFSRESAIRMVCRRFNLLPGTLRNYLSRVANIEASDEQSRLIALLPHRCRREHPVASLSGADKLREDGDA